MAKLRHARGFGRVAALALCGLLAADQDAVARRALQRSRNHRSRSSIREYTGKPNPAGPFIFANTQYEPVAFEAIDGWAARRSRGGLRRFPVELPCR